MLWYDQQRHGVAHCATAAVFGRESGPCNVLTGSAYRQIQTSRDVRPSRAIPWGLLAASGAPTFCRRHTTVPNPVNG